ncbi:phosphatidylserine decarboxylase [Pyricularia oryzae]|uniref:Phosphatidylserine decarboxylase proenzyme 2 n=2 Tax=Pyricularia oryzae TaxID=318829 RepID=A0AA97NVR7_PYRO3|nr:phosphatidylserine decarboxylase [Pyricularia oryzae Y34]KAI7924632.1 phosphatidylserine decarboxylase [Pyricularia oryzae]KAI7925245.1 phosphatidylserine decarboxylase [Pyricularia oryzae]
MVRIIPSRLKSSASISNTASTNNSRAPSPMRNKGDSASPEGRRETGLVLNIVILRGRNLAAKDRSGTSDPYLVLNCGDSKHVTATVSKSLNPEWNEQCEFPINGAQHLLLDVCAWDKDRFGKDYMGEFDLALEEIFLDEKTEQPPKWYPLKSKRPGKKTSVVSGEVLLQFTIFDSSNRDATRRDIYNKLMGIVKAAAPEAESSSRDPTPTLTPVLAPVRKPSSTGNSPSPPLLSRRQTSDLGDGAENGDDEYEIYDDETPDEPEEADDPNQPEVIEKRKRRLRIKGLKRKKRDNGFEFSNSSSDVVGIIFLEIRSITDLPPEHNFTRTSFDCDPFVVASLGKKTYRTRTIRHNLNPVFNEKMIFQVLNHEQQYSFSFTVIDRDKFSGNDFIASVNLPIKEIMDKAPRADPTTGLYELKDPPEYTPEKRSRFMRLSMSRSGSSASLSKLSRPSLSKSSSVASTTAQGSATPSQATPAPSTSPGASGMLSEAVARSNAVNSGLLTPSENVGAAAAVSAAATSGGELNPDSDDPFFVSFDLPLKMKNLEKWEDKHSPVLYIRAKYMPYPALRQQFWRALLRQYDANESGEISKVELTTMLDTLGSTLRDSTIDSFFQRFPHKAANGEDGVEITMDEAVLCLEDQLSKSRPGSTIGDKVKNMLPDAEKVKGLLSVPGHTASTASDTSSGDDATPVEGSSTTVTTEDSTIKVPDLSDSGMEGDVLERGDDLNDRGEEHVVMIRECPICHQPRLNRRKDADIVTHISTCASQDWRQVNNLMMAGFVTASQAHRKWYSKVITKISYGGYKLGANSANILVQDRLTGQINEEKMSVYVRLGIRLLYKGLKSNSMENKRIRKLLKSLSIKQGKKYDDPASTAEIQKFIEFHNLDMSEVLLSIDEFKSFNEFFYRALKPGARPCSAPDRPRIIVSPADCRCVVFNRVDVATKVWVKGRDFSIKRLLGDAYPEDAKRYENGGGLAIFRLAPQDYHRFHIPVDGVMGKPKTIAGEYYTVNPMAIRSALDVYGENVRVVVPIDSPEFGRVMVVCIGAMMVGSTVITGHEGDEVKRADELGYFKFGGSTLVVLFEEGKMRFDDDLVDNSNGALETLVRVGMSVGHHVNEPQWTPDMRKNENDITEQDKKDAKRRIQGAEFSDMTPEDSGPDETPSKPSLTTRIAG